MQYLCAWPPPGPHCPPILSSSTHWKAESALRGGCLPLLLLLLLLLFTSPQPYHHSLPHSWPSLPFITSLMVMNSAPSPPSTIYSFLHLCSGWKKVQDTSYCAPSITKCPPALPEILSLINVLALKGQPNWIKFWTSLNTTFLTNRRSWKNKTKGSCYLLNTA